MKIKQRLKIDIFKIEFKQNLIFFNKYDLDNHKL